MCVGSVADEQGLWSVGSWRISTSELHHVLASCQLPSQGLPLAFRTHPIALALM